MISPTCYDFILKLVFYIFLLWFSIFLTLSVLIPDYSQQLAKVFFFYYRQFAFGIDTRMFSSFHIPISYNYFLVVIPICIIAGKQVSHFIIYNYHLYGGKKHAYLIYWHLKKDAVGREGGQTSYRKNVLQNKSIK